MQFLKSNFSLSAEAVPETIALFDRSIFQFSSGLTVSVPALLDGMDWGNLVKRFSGFTF